MPVPKLKTYTSMILKLADAVEQAPFALVRAGAALRCWVTGKEQYLSLDVSYCEARRAAERHHLPSLVVRAEQQPVGVEASPGEVAIVAVRGAAANNSGDSPRILPVNARVHTLYTMAADLVREHGYEWGSAIIAARVCMAHVGSMSSLEDAGDEDEIEIPQAPLGTDS